MVKTICPRCGSKDATIEGVELPKSPDGDAGSPRFYFRTVCACATRSFESLPKTMKD